MAANKTRPRGAHAGRPTTMGKMSDKGTVDQRRSDSRLIAMSEAAPTWRSDVTLQEATARHLYAMHCRLVRAGLVDR